MLPAVMLLKPFPAPTKKLAVITFPEILPVLIFPLTINPTKLPTLVILGCAAVVNVPVKKLAVATLPKLALAVVRLPVIPTAFVFLSKVKPELPPKLLLSLNCTCVLVPPVGLNEPDVQLNAPDPLVVK